jgi:hypothetical protein
MTSSVVHLLPTPLPHLEFFQSNAVAPLTEILHSRHSNAAKEREERQKCQEEEGVESVYIDTQGKR